MWRIIGFIGLQLRRTERQVQRCEKGKKKYKIPIGYARYCDFLRATNESAQRGKRSESNSKFAYPSNGGATLDHHALRSAMWMMQYCGG